MSADALLVLQRSDVAHLAAERERFAGLKLLFIDPGIFDEAVQQQLPGIELRRLDTDTDLQARAFTEALSLATLVDQRLARLRRELFDGTLFDGWDVGLLYHGLSRLIVARQIGEACERDFAERRIGLLRPHNPMQFYFDSFAVPDVVARDPSRWQIVDGYDGARLYNANAYAFGFNTPAIAAAFAERPITAITHVPTCFYDRERIEREMAVVHPESIDLPSLIWDVPVRRRELLLSPLAQLPAPDPVCDTYAARARAAMETLLADLLPQASGRRLQLDAWAARCRQQAINYTGLHRALQGHAPTFVLTDHDTGHNGLLFSVADALGSAITVLPHSSHPAMVLPHARRVTAIERAGFRTPARTVLGQRVAVRPVRWKAAATPRVRSRVRTLCLLLNTAHTEGLTYNNLPALRAFFAPLAGLCERNDVDLLVRLKPGAPALSVMSGALGLPAQRLYDTLSQPLDDVAQRSDVCIAWGEPSTGMLAFLEAGAYVLNACQVAWPIDLLLCPPLVADGTVPSLPLNDSLQAVQRLIVDTAHFQAACRAQTEAVPARSADAHDHFLPHPTSSSGA